ncbi:MAG: 3-hydroxybutyryl-CoA dehydrogenase [Tissierellales bacterium]|nr:3-hydroxybutyryl-CoA dehydrogenase [Tissierellales bacterium]MBN2826671.1 3-hydroxybutyryl-CoA dehydrogenase [Tissierellales bacterium]
MKVFILGAGTMGAGIAQVFLTKGYQVILRDIKEAYVEKGKDMVARNLEKLVLKEKITRDDANKMMENLTITTDINQAKEADLVIEAAVENMDVKKEIFKELDAICHEGTILATNTSTLSITEVASVTNRPGQVIGMHFFNPAPVMELIEVIRGYATSDETCEKIIEISKKLGKNPVEVKEAPGFVVNRILVPMINEAVGLLADGVASVEDIDQAMKLGANHPIGPLALGDLIGLDVCLFIMEILYNEFGDSKYRPYPLLRKMVRAGKLGRKTKEGFYKY